MIVKRRVSISQIAKELGVSPSTVSRALNGHRSISKQMIESVQKLARELNYVPNQMAVSLKSGRRNIIGVIVPMVSRNFFSSVIEGIEDLAHSCGYDVLICQNKDSIEREKRLVESINGKVDAVIASLAAEPGNHDFFNNLSVPLVLFDRVDSTINASSVTVDDYGGARMATEHLLSQGFRRIYHFSGPHYINIWRNRCIGYMDTMKNAGIEIESQWIYQAPTTEQEGKKFASQILASGILPDAIFSAGDYAALGIMAEFNRHGITIPIVGFANEPFCNFIKPSLTSVNQHSLRMGNIACKMLLDLIEGQPAVNTIITPELIVRESSLIRK